MNSHSCQSREIPSVGVDIVSPSDTVAGMRMEYDRIGRPERRRTGLRGNTFYRNDIQGNLSALRTEVLLKLKKAEFPDPPFRNSIDAAFDTERIGMTDPFEPGFIANSGTEIFGDTLMRADGRQPLYNGRISSRKTHDGRYDYTYDSFGRLTEAAFSGSGLADYSTEYSYDENANITGMIRQGVVDRAGKSKIYGLLDATTVTLEGNRAVGYNIESDGDVFEGRTGFGSLSGFCEVQYDDNGNVAYDETTMTAYSYNRHNKPVLIEADDGSSLSLLYDGAGTLISRTQTSGSITSRTDFIGPYGLVDGKLKAVYFDGGYFDADGMVHYYVPDYQGNIIADVTASGEIVQTTSYYPYGEPWLEPEGDNRRLFAGKERLNFGAIRHSDFGARLLNSRAGIWTTQDSHLESYYNLSPYSVCGADPVNYIDNDGKDITLLTAGLHIAMLIGNDKEGWRYYSMNGDKIFQLTGGILGGSYKHNLGEETFPTVHDFINSYYNTGGTIEEIEADETSGYNYTEAYTIYTTSEQDLAASKAFINTANEGYEFFTNNCADAVSNSLRAAGFEFANINNDAYYKAYKLADNIQQNRYLTYLGPVMKYIVHKIDLFPTTVPTLIFNNFKQRYPDGKAYP